MMNSVFSKSQVLLYFSFLLCGLLNGCASISAPAPDPVRAEDLALKPVETLTLRTSPSAEAMAYFSLGLTRELEKDYPGAIEAFQEAIHKDPENDMLYMIASQRLIQADRQDDAFQLLHQLLEKQPENVTARRWLAKLHVGQDEVEKAREQLNLAIQQHPASERIYLEAIQLALRAQSLPDVLHLARQAHQYADHPVKCTEILVKLLIGEIQKAEDAKSLVALQNELNETLRKSIEDFPETETFSLILAEQQIEKDRWKEAFETYTELDRRFEGTEEIRGKILMNALRNSGGSDRGVRKLEQEMGTIPETVLNLYLRGLLKELTRQPDEALKAYKKAVEMDPDDFESLRKLALATYQSGQSQRARELIENILKMQPDDPEILLLAGQLALGAEDFRQARKYLEKCLLRVRQGAEVEDLSLVYTQLALARIAGGGDTQSIVDTMVEAAGKPGNLQWIWQFYAREIYLKKEDDPQSARQMEESFLHLLEDLSDRIPANPEVELLIGRSQVVRKNYSAAVDAYERYADLAMKSPQPEFWLNESYHFDLAAAYERAGRYEESFEKFEKIIKNNPNHHPSLNYVAYMWAERNRNLDQALAYARRALSLDPENGSYLDTLGWIYYQQGDFNAAYRELLKAAELIPDESVVAEHLGDVLMKLSRPWEAMGYYRIALILDPAERLETVQDSLQKAETAVSAAMK